ncbi:MAG: nucleotide exchange factor GrpE [Selenomonadaceae bacterium]|nr:nucleotide exchange factor GrpE [Selenomonadaceae bacterium]
MTFCLIGVKVCTKREVSDLTEEKKVIVNNEDGDSAEINLQMSQDPPEVEETAPDLAAELEKLKEELSAKDDRILRLQAEFANFRKRTAKENSELAAVIEQAFLKDLLPLLDNLNLASKAAENADNADVEALRKGIEMIKQETVAVMGKHGLEPIETLNKPFDPNYHQAVGAVKDETKEDGTIAAEFQRGYIARGRVIRPSMVQVVNNA